MAIVPMKKLRLNIAEFYAHCRACTDRVCMKACPQKLRIPELIEMIYELSRQPLPDKKQP